MKDLKISVIIPVHDTNIKYLEKCFNSIYSQKYKNFECIVVNDGSKNYETNQYIYESSKKFKNFFICNLQTPTGPGNARNVGVRTSSGDIIFYVDSDDYIIEEIFEKVNLLFNQFPELDIFSFENKNLRNNGLLVSGELYAFETSVPVNVNTYKNAILDKCSCWAKAYSKNFLMKNNIWFPTDDVFGEDMFYLIVTYSKAKQIMFSSHSYYVMSLSDDSRSRTPFTITKAKSFFKAIKLAYEKIKNDNSYISKKFDKLMNIYFYKKLIDEKANIVLNNNIEYIKLIKESKEFKEFVKNDQLKIV